MIAGRVIVFLIGVAVVVATLGSAIRTVILPRGVPARLGRAVFLSMRALFRLRARPSAPYERRDRVMAVYAPVSLIVLLLVWISMVLLGYMGMFWGLGHRSLREAFRLSGSSIVTLGFERGADLPSTVLVFTEAALGLILLALLITYLPTLYSTFSRREATVAALEVRAGAPPSAVEMIERYWVLERIEHMTEVWERWEGWFVELEETHTSIPSLVFFRSPHPDHSWVTAAGAVLDAASLMASTVDHPREVQAEFCIRAGYLALRRICDFFGIPYEHHPSPTDPISIGRSEYEEACDRLAAAGVPLKPDRDQTWRDFAGWRVNYDVPLIALAGLTMAPFAQWSSDRGIRDFRPPLFRRQLRAIITGPPPEEEAESAGQGALQRRPE